MKAVIYVRVSTDEQAEQGYSLPTQIRACEKYAQEHDLSVVAVLSDDYTGTVPIEQRPQGAKAYAMLAQGEADALIAYAIDRLVRPPEEGDEWDLPVLIRGLAKLKKEIHTCNRGRLNTDFASLLITILDAKGAGDDRRKILERTARGRRGKAEAGLYVGTGRPPYGYRREEAPASNGSRRRHIVLALNKREARIVVLIYNWYVYGDESGRPLSFNGIAQKLTAMGIASPGVARQSPLKKSSPAYWFAYTVRSIIHNETYAGTWHYGRLAWVGKRPHLKAQVRPRSEWIPVAVPAIVDRDLWAAAQKRAQANHHLTRPNPKGQYLMQTRLRCAHCGRAFTGHSHAAPSRRYAYYYCRGTNAIDDPHRSTRRCASRGVRVDSLDRCVWEWLRSLFEQPEKLSIGLRDRQAEQDQATQLLRSRLQALEDEEDDCRRKLANLIDLCAETSSATSKAIFAEKEAELDHRISSLQREREELAERIRTDVIGDREIATIESLARDVRIVFEHAAFQDRRALVDLLDVRGLISIVDGGKAIVQLSCVLEDTAAVAIERLSCHNAENQQKALLQSVFDSWG